MAGKSKEEEINIRQRERERESAQIGFCLTDIQTAEEEEITCVCVLKKPLAGDCKLQARWLMLLMDLFYK